MWSHLDLFSGIGGFALAAQWTGRMKTIGFCEIDAYCQRVLAKNFPGVPIHDDARTLTGQIVRGWLGAEAERERNLGNAGRERRQQIAGGAHGDEATDEGRSAPNDYQPERDGQGGNGPIDLITAGYPCQPFSHAGKRLGAQDDRHLWPEVARLVDELRPHWLLLENVAGHVSMGLDDVLADLEARDYTWGAVVIPACAVNAPHRRDRVWIVAHTEDGGIRRGAPVHPGLATQRRQAVPDTTDGGRGAGEQHDVPGRGESDAAGGGWWDVEPDVGRVAHGVPRRVDRLKALGNAIVPHVAHVILKAMLEADDASKP